MPKLHAFTLQTKLITLANTFSVAEHEATSTARKILR